MGFFACENDLLKARLAKMLVRCGLCRETKTCKTQKKS
jgi:hypothetical protein